MQVLYLKLINNRLNDSPLLKASNSSFFFSVLVCRLATAKSAVPTCTNVQPENQFDLYFNSLNIRMVSNTMHACIPG